MDDFDVFNYAPNCDLVKTGKINIFYTDPLASKQRAQMYDFIRSHYPELDVESVPIIGMSEKKMVITLRSIRKEKNNGIIIFEHVAEKPIDSFIKRDDALMTSEFINIFSYYAKIPIPVTDPKYFSYYMEIMDKYFGCFEKKKVFMKYIEPKKPGEIKSEIGRLLKIVVSHIKSSSEYAEFLNVPYVRPPDLLTKNKLYCSQHAGNYFVSVDMKSANYSVLREFCPTLSKKNWREFISDFTDSEFIIQSKQIREIIFGVLGNKTILKFASLIINYVGLMQILKFPEIKKVFCSEDEIVFKVNEDFDLDLFTKSVNELCPSKVVDASEIYRVEMYKLVQLGQFDFFVREFTDGRRDFKNVPKKFIAQCIKYYEKNEILEVDRKFTDELGIVATYDAPLDFV